MSNGQWAGMDYDSVPPAVVAEYKETGRYPEWWINFGELERRQAIAKVKHWDGVLYGRADFTIPDKRHR